MLNEADYIKVSMIYFQNILDNLPFVLEIIQFGCIAQLVTCLASDAYITADPGVGSSIPTWSDTVILLPSTESFKNGFCQLQAKVSAQSTG